MLYLLGQVAMCFYQHLKCWNNESCFAWKYFFKKSLEFTLLKQDAPIIPSAFTN